ncbi:unnamed protein product [Schistosoma turkestanicum]|nr:unnamed protein product [Schistosoma turkestanicum]
MSSEKYEVDLVDFSNSDVKPSNSSSNFTQKPTTAVENGCRPDNHESESTNLEPPISEQLLLNLNVCQARLVKNHGFFPMRLYCRVLIGDAIFETHTESGAGKHPIWNKTFQCWLHDGVDRLKVEVVSENIIFSNSQVAHAVIIFPRCLLNGIAVDQWFDLSGNQGESSAGSINLIFQCQVFLQKTLWITDLNQHIMNELQLFVYGSI